MPKQNTPNRENIVVRGVCIDQVYQVGRMRTQN